VRVKGAAPADVLSVELRTLLMHGPYAINKRPSTIPAHDELRKCWTMYGPSILASMPRGHRPWFVDKDYLVRVVRGEPDR
jgi:hypothetical protein